MASRKLLLSPAAKADIRAIYQRSLGKFGRARTEAYLEGIKESMWTLTSQPLLGIDRSELLPELRSLVVATHIIFYRALKDRVEIVRVLHARQDPATHLP